MIKLTAAVSWLLLLGSPAFASDTPQERATLKGVKVIQVIIENLKPEVERDGLLKSQLQTDVELRLRQSGINVSEDSLNVLYVDVLPLKVNDASRYAYSIRVAFETPVATALAPKTFVMGTTWSTSMIGIVGSSLFVSETRNDVRDQVDKFINAFLSVNPKS